MNSIRCLWHIGAGRDAPFTERNIPTPLHILQICAMVPVRKA